MDKNTLTGLLLMGLVIFGFMWLNKPSAEELERQRQEKARMEAEAAQKAEDTALLTLDSIRPAEVATIAATVRELGQNDTTTNTCNLHVEASDKTLPLDEDIVGELIADEFSVPMVGSPEGPENN